jgi:glycolate oxidase
VRTVTCGRMPSLLEFMDRTSSLMIDDVCVPRTRLAELTAGVEAISAEIGLVIAVYGHAGDGNFHPTVVFDPAAEEQARLAKECYDRVMALGLGLGGTITGEHGVGLLKRTWLRSELGERSYALQQSIKSVFDPLGILNPGKVL